MLTDREIRLLKEKAKRINCLYWRDPDGVAHQVRRVQLEWVEDKSQPELAEPVAVLVSGKVVALHNVELAEFVTLQPLTLGDREMPTEYVDRVIDALALLCHGNRPPRELVEAWFRNESEALQDWAVNNTSLCWGTGIGTIVAAMAMADTPEEGIGGIGGKEHQMRDEAFPADKVSAELTPLEHLMQAFDLSGVPYAVRDAGDGWTNLFVGDALQDAQRMGDCTAETAPLELLEKLDLRLFEFDDDRNIASC